MNENSRRVNKNAKCDFIQIGPLEVFLGVWTNGHQMIQDHIPRSETSDSQLCEPQILYSGDIMPVESPVIQEIGRLCSLRNKSVGKAVPLQAWSGPEGSSKLRFPDFMTTAQDGGKVVSFTHRPPLPPGNTPGTHFC
jgi:hypothetical protein